MNRTLVRLLALLGLAVLPLRAPAQQVIKPSPMRLWSGAAPGALGNDSTDIPTIALYQPRPGTATGALLIICPGGAYEMLAADYEGHDVAVWLNTLGITAIVLRYRLGPRYQYPAALQDVARAIRVSRSRAAAWGIDPARVGVFGFSAGGHLAATIATHFDAGNPTAADPIDRLSSRPDVAVLAYPVISMEQGITHAGSRRNLLGAHPSTDLITLLSNEKQVTSRTPPTFLFHTADDPVVPVENSQRFAAALHAANVPYELHIFPHGPHGVGLAQGNRELSPWTMLLVDWLHGRGFVR